MTPLADQSSVFYTGPFWFQVVGYGTFFLGALFAAARLQADGLVRHAPWRYWQAACFCLCLWTLSRLTTIALPESSDVGSITDTAGNPILGSPRFQLQRKANGDSEWVPYYPATEKGDPLAEGARFAPLGGRGEIYYYLQFDVILLVAAGVFALLALNEARGEPVERKEGEGADA
ncbi:MAG: hypothetical protein K8T20_11520 [Planctomycetes bacterium]|nr:hypothetical protein [Planctomycetota bacterium]